MVLRICVTGLSVYFSWPTYCGIGLAAGVSLVAVTAGVLLLLTAATLNSSISFFTMRPPSAVPFTSFRLMPLSRAILRANGEAFTRLSSLEELVAVAGAVAVSSFLFSAGASSVLLLPVLLLL